MEDAEATTEGFAVEIQAGATGPLSQPSVKKGALHVTIAMEKLIASTVEKKAPGKMCAPLLLEKQQSQLQMNIIVEDEAVNKENED